MTILGWGIILRMSDSDINDTVPMPVETLQPDSPSAAEKQRKPWKWMIPLGLLALLVIFAASAYAGYAAGITQRKNAEIAITSQQAAEQFELALEDIANGQYQRARQRLEYVAVLDPNYPGLTERLAEVLARINATATPTLAPTPTVAPTADLRDIESIFSQAQQQMASADWSGAIETMLRARKEDPNFRAIEIDGMLFIALRNRGLEKISRQADLEGGLYDLTLASRFSPLDSEALGYYNWVSLYITGASFWELDWEKAVEYFSQVGPALPGLTDRSGYTARERYRLALKGFATTLASRGDFCAAVEQFQLSLSIGPDPEVDQLLADAYLACQGGESESTGEEESILPTESFPPVGTPPPIEVTPPQETPPPAEETPYPPPTTP